MTETFAIHDRLDVRASDAESFGKRSLCLDSPQGADFDRLFAGDAPRSSVSESMFPVGSGDKMGGIDAGFLFAPMMDDKIIGKWPVFTFVGDAMGDESVGGLPVSTDGDESLPDVAWGIASPVFLDPCLGEAPVMTEAIPHRLPFDQSTSGVRTTSDGCGITAPTLTQAIVHIQESTALGGA